MWQRVRGRTGWELGGPREQRATIPPWRCRSRQPCALHRSLQLPPATARGSLHSPRLHASAPGLRLLPGFLQRGAPPQPPSSRHSPGPYGWEWGPPANRSSQPWSCQAGLQPQDRRRCLPRDCAGVGAGGQWPAPPCFAGGHPGATHTSCACSGPRCSRSARPAPALALRPIPRHPPPQHTRPVPPPTRRPPRCHGTAPWVPC